MHYSAKRGLAIACRLSVRPSVRLTLVRPKKIIVVSGNMAAKNRVGRSEFFLNFSPTMYYRFKWSAYKPVQISAPIYKNSIKFLGSAGKN